MISNGFSAIGRGLLRLLLLSGRRWQGLYVIGGGVECRLKLLPELLRFGAKTEKRGTKIVQGFVVGLGVVQALLDPVEFLAPVLYPAVDVQAHRIVGLLEDRGMVDFWRLHGRAWRRRRGLGGGGLRTLGHGASAHDGENREKRGYNRATPQQHWIRPHSGSSNAAQVY